MSKSAIETIIEPQSGWTLRQLVEIWHRREVILLLGRRDLSVRYKQTALGVSWALIQPVVLMVVFSVIFGKVAAIPSDGIPYPVFSYSGLLPWLLFAGSMNAVAMSVVNNRTLVTKVYFPRLALPISATAPVLVDFAISFVVLVALMVYYGLIPGWGVLTLPLFALLAWIAAMSVGIWMAALNVYYRDFRYIVPFLTQIWLFLTPVIYPMSLTTEPYRTILTFNPMVGVVEGFRWALIGQGSPDWWSIGVSATISFVILVLGIAFFRRMEQSFSDVI